MTPEDYHRLEAVDFAIANSKSLDELVGYLETVAPDMAASIEGKSLMSARSPLGVLLFYALGELLAYSLQLGFEATAGLVGIFVLVGAYVMRIATRTPITGLFRTRQV